MIKVTNRTLFEVLRQPALTYHLPKVNVLFLENGEIKKSDNLCY